MMLIEFCPTCHPIVGRLIAVKILSDGTVQLCESFPDLHQFNILYGLKCFGCDKVFPLIIQNNQDCGVKFNPYYSEEATFYGTFNDFNYGAGQDLDGAVNLSVRDQQPRPLAMKYFDMTLESQKRFRETNGISFDSSGFPIESIGPDSVEEILSPENAVTILPIEESSEKMDEVNSESKLAETIDLDKIKVGELNSTNSTIISNRFETFDEDLTIWNQLATEYNIGLDSDDSIIDSKTENNEEAKDDEESKLFHLSPLSFPTSLEQDSKFQLETESDPGDESVVDCKTPISDDDMDFHGTLAININSTFIGKLDDSDEGTSSCDKVSPLMIQDNQNCAVNSNSNSPEEDTFIRNRRNYSRRRTYQRFSKPENHKHSRNKSETKFDKWIHPIHCIRTNRRVYPIEIHETMCINRTAGKEKQKYICKIPHECKRSFKRLTNMENHVFRHFFYAPCPNCGRKCTSYYSLNTHLKKCAQYEKPKISLIENVAYGSENEDGTDASPITESSEIIQLEPEPAEVTIRSANGSFYCSIEDPDSLTSNSHHETSSTVHSKEVVNLVGRFRDKPIKQPVRKVYCCLFCEFKTFSRPGINRHLNCSFQKKKLTAPSCPKRKELKPADPETGIYEQLEPNLSNRQITDHSMSRRSSSLNFQ